MIEQLEADVAGFLSPLEALGFEVVCMPESKAGHNAAVTLETPRVSVCYRESTFPDERPIYAGLGEALAQPETVHIDVVIRAKFLRDKKGAYATIGAVRALLLGRQTTNAGSIRFSGQRLETFEEVGVWRYSLSLEMDTIAVAAEVCEPAAIIRTLSAYWKPEGPESARPVVPTP